MTFPEPPPLQRGPILPEVLGLLLLVLGAGAVIAAAFWVDWRLGTATCGLAALAAGAFLTRSEV